MSKFVTIHAFCHEKLIPPLQNLIIFKIGCFPFLSFNLCHTAFMLETLKTFLQVDHFKARLNSQDVLPISFIPNLPRGKTVEANILRTSINIPHDSRNIFRNHLFDCAIFDR